MPNHRVRRRCHWLRARVAHRPGWTVRELLVVTGLMAIAFALAMPFVERSRAKARRDVCTHRMRNLALAMMQYDTQRQQLPGWANVVCPDPITGNEVPGRSAPASWGFELLPYLDQGSLYQQYGAGKPGSAPGPRNCLKQGPPTEHLAEFVCPSDKREFSDTNSLSYIVNCGLRDRGFTNASIGRAGDEGASYRDFIREPTANGVFHNNYFRLDHQQRYGRPHYTTNSLALVSASDGTASTLMLSENLDATYWTGGSQPDQLDLTEGTLCFCWPAVEPKQIAMGPKNLMRINAGAGTAPGRAPRPSSQHAGGVNVIFCDAHSAFVVDDVDWVLWCNLHTPNGIFQYKKTTLRAPSLDVFQEHPALAPYRSHLVCVEKP